MENDKGELVDLLVPRKCSATNRIIKAKDHASVQISVGKVDENGRYTGENQVYALCGFVRSMGESDDSLNRCWAGHGVKEGNSGAAGMHGWLMPNGVAEIVKRGSIKN
ncbi:hypothetical protein V492_06180 [Pseudogymnoascus sp. VKM F-4246]|nr:hypothetical protein V492_06180 [Pseudogymnoascus sp. VKM F-4246]KFY43674.1 hypothetical protein V494_01879 [Pseudogymnoascus sp. VKM F-4513 (FW-928)]